MINLLPDFDKKQIRAGRVNHLLVRYTVIMGIILVVMVAEFLLAYIYMQYTKGVSERTIADNQSKSQEILKKKQDVEEFRNNLSTAKQILDKQVDYSAITLEIASLIPKNVVVEQMTIDPTTFGSGATILAKATNDTGVRRLKTSLETSSYFDDVHFDTIVLSDDDDPRYPYTITLSITFKRELLNR